LENATNTGLSFIHPDAKIGQNVTIDPFTVIHNDVVIGDNCWIGSHAVIMPGSRIGNNCKIFPSAVIGGIPQDLKFDGEYSTVEIGDNTTIREFVTINRGTIDKEVTKVGQNCLIMAYSHIAHDCIIGDYCVFSNNTTLAGHIVIGDYVVLAGLVAVQQFIKIGSHAFVTGGSLVRKDIPPFVKAAREPLSYVGVNSIGLRRRGFSVEKINHIMDIYRILYVRNYPINKALSLIELEIPHSEEKEYIVSFIKESQKGIMKGYSS